MLIDIPLFSYVIVFSLSVGIFCYSFLVYVALFLFLQPRTEIKDCNHNTYN